MGGFRLKINPLLIVFIGLLASASLGAAFVAPQAVSQANAGGPVPVIIVPADGVRGLSIESDSPLARSGPSSLSSGPSGPPAFLPGIRGLHSVSAASGLWAANVTAFGLAKLAADPSVAAVYYDRPVQALDAATNAQINADDVQRFQLNGQNLTGVNQTICVVDTGIDYTHESLGACSGYYRSLVPNETVSFFENDTLSFRTGQMSFPTGPTDTQTTDHSYVLISSARTQPFGLVHTVPQYFDGHIYTYASFPFTARDAYLITDNRTNGNATTGLVMVRDPQTSQFIPYIDPRANLTVTFAPPLDHFSVSWPYDAYLYTLTSPSGCQLPANGTPLFRTDLSLSNWILQSNFTFAPLQAYPWGAYASNLTANLTINASSLNASCTGGLARVSFERFWGFFAPGLNNAGVTYSIQDNYLSYQAGPVHSKIRIHVPGISMGAAEPNGPHALWIPEPQAANASLQSALSLDIGFGDQATPHLIDLNGTVAAGFTFNYSVNATLPDQAASAGFSTPRGNRLNHLGLSSAELYYSLADNASVVESAHPYGTGHNTTWLVRHPGYSSIRLHFSRFSVERGYDYVFIETPQGQRIANYTGVRNDFWTPAIPGDTAVIRLESDYVIEANGFTVDRVSNSSADPFERWSCDKVLPGTDTISQNEDGFDDHFHGTHVAGIAAASGNITGVAPGARLVSAKVLDSGGFGSESTVIAGIDWCVSKRDAFNISIITMSLGTGSTASDTCADDPMSGAIARAVQAGIFVSVASGNSYNPFGVSYPACSPNATAVGAVDSNDLVAGFSNAWNRTLVLAPGVSVLSTMSGNTTGRLSGTSMATPHVAGLAALLQDFAMRANRTLMPPAYLSGLLFRTGVPVNDTRNGRSYPRIDAWAALQALQSDVSPRNLSLTSFANGSLVPDAAVDVNVSFFDDGPLQSCVLHWNNGTATNASMAIANATCSGRIAGQSGVNGTGSVVLTDAYGNTANLSFHVRFAPALGTVRLNVANGTVSSNESLTVSGTFAIPDARTCVLSVDGANRSANSSDCQFNVSLTEGWHALTLYVIDASNQAGQSPTVYVLADRTAPRAPSLSATTNASGFIRLQWTAATDAFGIAAYTLYRNGTRLANLESNQTRHDDRTPISGFTYSYQLFAIDLAANTNASQNATATANDSVAPQPVVNLTASNEPDGSINLTWNPVTHDAAGEPEQNVTYFVYRSANASLPPITPAGFSIAAVSANASLLGNTTSTYWRDTSVLQTNATYSYAVLASDANQNVNTSAASNNSLNQTTATTCTAVFSEFSACSGSTQSRTRICFGQVQTETQSCSTGSGSGGGSTGGGSSGGSSGSSPSSASISTSTSSGPRGGGAGGGSGQSFVIENLPGVMDFSRGIPASSKLTVSSSYTGYLRYLNFTLKGIPRDWYEVLGPTVVTPISKTDFWISWRIPENAQGRFPVTLELSGVGTKNAGILRTQYAFELVLSNAPSSPGTPASSGGSASGSTGSAGFVPLQSTGSSGSSNSAQPAPFSGAVTASSIQLSDGLFLFILLVMGIAGYAWVHGGSARKT